MRKILLSLLLLSSIPTFAQHAWVYYTDKPEAPENLDAPVHQAYVDSLEALGIKFIGHSKWFNASCIQENTAVNWPSFVEKVKPLGRYKTHKCTTARFDSAAYGWSDWQLQMLGLDSFHRKGFTGKDVTIALMDAGFYRADTLPAFDSMWQNNRVKGYWNFITNDTTIFWEYDGHGKFVLSIVGANWPDSMIGAAPDANFLLARTEVVGSEKHLEEYAWVKAMEWADSMGANIIHSSLGYSRFDTLEGDYIYADMDGETTIITQATDIAFSKGIFVTNSAGNEGGSDWHYITAPCDGKHVLCVGAVDSNQEHASFSSYGPSADGRVKPDVVAMGKGVTYVANSGRLRTGNGTSFSGPLIAGMVACLKQAWPNMTNAQIYRAIIESADRYDSPDTAYGYGLPNVIKADSILNTFVSVKEIQSTVGVYPNPTNGIVHIRTIDASISGVEVHSIEGKSVLNDSFEGRKNVELNVTSLPPGSYLLLVHLAGGETLVKRLQKI